MRSRRTPVQLSAEAWGLYRERSGRVMALAKELLEEAGRAGIRVRIDIRYPNVAPPSADSKGAP